MHVYASICFAASQSTSKLVGSKQFPFIFPTIPSIGWWGVSMLPVWIGAQGCGGDLWFCSLLPELPLLCSDTVWLIPAGITPSSAVSCQAGWWLDVPGWPHSSIWQSAVVGGAGPLPAGWLRVVPMVVLQFQAQQEIKTQGSEHLWSLCLCQIC